MGGGCRGGEEKGVRGEVVSEIGHVDAKTSISVPSAVKTGDSSKH